MYTSILLSTLALTLAAASAQFPQQQNVAYFLTTPKPYIPIISRNEVRDDSGQVISSYQSADGTSFEQVDVLKPSLNPKKPKVIVQQGTYSYTSPDGTPVQVSYIADEKGFRAVGTHIFSEVPVVPDAPVDEPAGTLKMNFPAPPPVPVSSLPPVSAPAPLSVSFPSPPPAPLPTPFPKGAFPTPLPVPSPASSPVDTRSAAPTAPGYPFVTFPSAPGVQLNPSSQSLAFPTVFIRQF